MSPQPPLETLLRSLKLPGMADMLGERLAQAASAQLGHAELLALLCGDELARRDAAGLARRLAAARFESTAAIEDFDFGYNPDVPAGTIRHLATLRFLDRGESIILHGPVGVGETMLAQALGQLACRRGHTAAFTKTSRLLADLAGGHADHTWATRLRRWADVVGGVDDPVEDGLGHDRVGEQRGTDYAPRTTRPGGTFLQVEAAERIPHVLEKPAVDPELVDH